jgi:hypothetical protein
MRVLRQCRRLALYLESHVSMSDVIQLIYPSPMALNRKIKEVVPDSVVRSQANPLRDGAVLLLRLRKLLLGTERLLAL